MESGQPIVYLEDLENCAPRQPSPDDASPTGVTATETEAPTSSPPTGSQKSVGASGVKRQRTLVDMFGAPPKKDGPASKRLKTGGSTLTTTSSVASSRPAMFGSQPLNSIPFSLSAFQNSLSEEDRSLLRLECEVMGKSWLKLLKDEITKPYFIALKKFLWDEGVRGANDTPKSIPVFPPPKNIYTWSDTPLGKVKVVIVGQDPYHGAGQAHGLCFSVPRGISIPPSLINIYREIKSEYPEFNPPKHGNLTAWAQNGVLMLNTCLTVRSASPGSHSNKGWEQFTDRVVDVVDRYGGANLTLKGGSEKSGVGRGVVFLAWGAWAAKRVAKLNKTRHLILSSAHPSPKSADRGFFGNGHFRAANAWLEDKYGKDGCVEWCQLDVPASAT